MPVKDDGEIDLWNDVLVEESEEEVEGTHNDGPPTSNTTSSFCLPYCSLPKMLSLFFKKKKSLGSLASTGM
jgi:hypothetical protein